MHTFVCSFTHLMEFQDLSPLTSIKVIIRLKHVQKTIFVANSQFVTVSRQDYGRESAFMQKNTPSASQAMYVVGNFEADYLKIIFM